VYVLCWRFLPFQLGWEVLNQRRAVHFDMFFSLVSSVRSSILFLLEIVAMRWNFAFGGNLDYSYFFRSMMHLEIVDVIDTRPTLDRLNFL
jgi:hypothetical protein